MPISRTAASTVAPMRRAGVARGREPMPGASHTSEACAPGPSSGGPGGLVQQGEGRGRIRRKGHPGVAGAADELVVGLVDREQDLVATPSAVEKNVHVPILGTARDNSPVAFSLPAAPAGTCV